MEYINKYGKIVFRDTPWNYKSLNGKSLEIESIESKKENTIKLISEFCAQKSKESYLLISSRINPAQLDLKKVYYLCGFITVEHILEVSSFGLDFKKIEHTSNKFQVEVLDYTNDNIFEIEDISKGEFNFGKFYEDPFIEPSKATARSRFWIGDIINQNATIKVLKKKNNIVGFMAYKVKNKRADLMLGGIKEKYRHLAYGFWANILLDLKDLNQVNTLISSSNVDIINLYSYFGFRFENAQFGLHKHLGQYDKQK
tara:strand:+ start:2812 stop:3579 length:768 start_codon:yes stop_codon:yes gene_type:complete